MQKRAILFFGWRVSVLGVSDSVGDGAVDAMVDVIEEEERESRSPSVGAGAMFLGSDMVLVLSRWLKV